MVGMAMTAVDLEVWLPAYKGTTRFPPGPLVAASRQGTRELARRLGVDAAVLCRPLTMGQADRFALHIGRMPWEIWPEWLDAPEPARRVDLED
jgi:hypothetical protein